MIFPVARNTAAEFAVLANLLGWLGFGAVLLAGKRGAAKGATKRDFKSSLGFLLQCVSYVACAVFPRRVFSPFLPLSSAGQYFLAALTIALTAASVWFCWAAARALGRQWALVARIIEGHELIVEGPYRLIRNPIYFAMLGMLLATGFAVARWQVLILAIAIFLAGTAFRIRTEENLLREAFGEEFDDYARRVPAFIPRLLR